MTTLKISGTGHKNAALVNRLLPTPNELADLPSPGLQALIIFELPECLMWRACCTKTVIGPLEELYCYANEKKKVRSLWISRRDTPHREWGSSMIELLNHITSLKTVQPETQKIGGM